MTLLALVPLRFYRLWTAWGWKVLGPAPGHHAQYSLIMGWGG